MTDKPVESEAQEADAWLDGLAGRSGEGAAHAEGAQLRRAFAQAPEPAMPPWSAIEAKASATPQGDAVAGQSLAGRQAANQSSWRGVGIAAVLVMATVLAVRAPWGDTDDGARPTLRGGASTGQVAAPVWLAQEPAKAADELASSLRAVGATVELRAEPQGLAMSIVAPASAVQAVNEQLASLEMALGSDGHLTLLVKAANH